MKGYHGQGKFYQTTAEKVMKSINVEITRGHNIGITASFLQTKRKRSFGCYLKAVDLLTFSQNNEILDKKSKGITGAK